MSLIDNAMAGLAAVINERFRAAAPFRATVASVSDGMVAIKRLGANTAETELRARLPGWTPSEGDEVLCLPVNGKPFVLGRVQRGPDDPGGGTSHDPVTVTDTASIDLTLTGQNLKADARFGTSAGTVAEGSALAGKVNTSTYTTDKTTQAIVNNALGSDIDDLQTAVAGKVDAGTYASDKAAQSITNAYLENRIDSLDPVTSITKVLTADLSTTVGYLTPTDLSIAMVSGEVWVLDYTLYLTSPGSAGIPMWPLAPSSSTWRASIQGSGASESALRGDVMATGDSFSAAFVTYAGDGAVHVHMYVEAGSTTNCVVATGAVSGGTAYIRAGSSVTARRIA